MAEFLLQRTKASSVSAIFRTLISEFRGPRDVIELSTHWTEMTASLGLVWRSRTFVEACKAIVSEYNGSVPDSYDELIGLPGVGPYIASAVLCFAFGQRTVIVDANTIKIASRLSGRSLKASRHRTVFVQEEVSRLGDDGIPPKSDENFALLDLAGIVCLNKRPQCSNCPVLSSCITGKGNLQ